MNEGFIRMIIGAWKEIGEPKVGRVKERLLLPDEYEVCATTRAYNHGVEWVDICVRSKSIPESARLLPIYRRIDQTPEFVRMEVVNNGRG